MGKLAKVMLAKYIQRTKQEEEMKKKIKEQKPMKEVMPVMAGLIENDKKFSPSEPPTPTPAIVVGHITVDKNLLLLDELLKMYIEYWEEGGSGELKEAYRETVQDLKKSILKRMTRIVPEELYDALRATYPDHTSFGGVDHCANALNWIQQSRK
jgi:hypothetical protein